MVFRDTGRGADRAFEHVQLAMLGLAKRVFSSRPFSGLLRHRRQVPQSVGGQAFSGNSSSNVQVVVEGVERHAFLVKALRTSAIWHRHIRQS